MMETAKEIMEITELTIEEVVLSLIMGDAPEGTRIMLEIVRSPHTP